MCLQGKTPSAPSDYHPQHTSMSFDNSSSCMDNILGVIHGESSTIPSSHYKALAHTPASRPQGCQTPKPPRTSGFPRQAVTPTIAFDINSYKLCRGDCFLPYPLLAEVSGQAQSKTVRHDRFTLGARGHLPSRPIVSSLWVLKQFAPTLPGGSMLGSF